MPDKPSITNCHTHIFTGDHVPPYLAKTFLPWPFYYLFPVSLIVSGFRWYYKTVDPWRYKPFLKRVKLYLYSVTIFFQRTVVGQIVSFLVTLLLTIHVFYIIHDSIQALHLFPHSFSKQIDEVKGFLSHYSILYIPSSPVVKFSIVVLFLIIFKSGRNLLFFVLKKVWKFIEIAPGKKTRGLIDRYINIGRFAFHTKQVSSLKDLQKQYPPESKFIILPMDMEFMDAGKLKKGHSYINQMEELYKIKKRESLSHLIFPFVFADPRRIKADPDYFKYTLAHGKVVLENCFIKKYIEEGRFSGFKIYPALGYYPFDEGLLALWKYASDNEIPIMTHCIKGTIFYRGKKEKDWDRHPIFQQNIGKDQYCPLLLSEVKNVDFCNNFTHPLNYLCLLEEKLLRKVVQRSVNPDIRKMFGYTRENTPLKYDLSKLKICFAHFGGDDEWRKFFEMDRYDFSNHIITRPSNGIDFFRGNNSSNSPGKIEQLWRNVDWYSIICSIILQYENVYADLSYIIHNDEIYPLLNQTLSNPKLRQKVLFGTDFYVVRNHKSEKNMHADILHKLSTADFDLIARTNPQNFLANKITY